MIVIVLPDIAAEDRLLALARQGNLDAIRQIYEDYFPPIYNFIRLRTDDTSVAEDLSSEVFLKLVAALRGRTAPTQSLRGWLFRVARSVLYDHYGERERLSETALEEWVQVPFDDLQEARIIRNTDIENTRQAIQQLPFEQQEVLILRFGQALSLQETAHIMDKNVQAIKSLQFRAVNALRRVLKERTHGR